jgi:predicted transcriptional regulator
MLEDYEIKFKGIENIPNTDPVWKWMKPSPCAVSGKQNLREAASLLKQYELEGLPVVDDTGAALGMITKTRLIACLVEGYASDCTAA